MSKRKKIALTFCGVLLAVLAAGVYGVHKGNQGHIWWHECRANCCLIDDAKRICAERRHLAAGTMVGWQDIQPYLTNSQYQGLLHLSPTGMPNCPAGGTYTLGKIGSWSMCSIPYHQWPNCKNKDTNAAWRD